MARDRERLANVHLAAEHVTEIAADHQIPVAFTQGALKLIRQATECAGVISVEVFVIRHLRGDKNRGPTLRRRVIRVSGALVVEHAFRRRRVNEIGFQPLMRPTAWVGCQNDARQLCRQTLRRLPTAQPITRAQEADLIRRKLTRLINQQRVDFSALVAVDVAVAFGVSASDARAVEKLKGFAVFVPLAQRLG